MRHLTLALCLSACPPLLAEVDAGPTVNPSWKHAHNDYEHPRPLFDALDQKFQSVEADIWLNGKKILAGANDQGFCWADSDGPFSVARDSLRGRGR